MNLKKISIILFLAIALSSCSDNIAENIKTINNNVVIEKNTEKKINLISVWISEFKQELAKKDWILIDLRTSPEIDNWIIAWAKQIDFYAPDLKEKLNSLDKNKKYLIYCRSWNRSGKALILMKKLWFTNVINLKWWIKDWISSWEKIIK